MANNKHNSPLATSYASAILELATEQNSVEPVGQELRDLRQVVRENTTFKAFLSDPSVGEEQREKTGGAG